MKAVFTVLLLMASFQVQAGTPQRYTEVTLDVLSISESSPISHYQVTDGLLTIDHYQDSAKLMLFPAMPTCPPGLYCTLAMPAPVIIEFDNLEVEEGACGEFIFTAVIDESPSDGFIETLEIVDNTYNKCMHIHVLDQFEVTYTTFAPMTQTTSVAKFKGPKEQFVTLPVQPYITK